jgi:nucleoside-diphosphate-sugar epimerase
MRVLVTGATGFVASHLLPALVERGDETFALGHDAERIPVLEGVEPLVVDLAQTLPSLPTVDAVVHLAQANVPFPEGARDLFAVNVASTVGLLDHVRTRGAGRFVFASSASVYGFGDAPFTEEDIPAATDFYSATKLAAEGFVRAYRDQLHATAVLRLVAPYGPGQTGRLLPALVGRVREGRPVTLNEGGRPRMNPIYVDDVVGVIVRALESDDDLLLNVAGDDASSIGDLAELIGEAVGTPPIFEEGAGGAAGDLVAVNERMKRELELPDLVPLGEGIRRTVDAEVRA